MPKAINISAIEAKEIKSLPSNTVLISINQPDEPLVPLKLDRNSSKILTVRFWDICSNREYNGQTITPIDYETCCEILNFIKRHRGQNFVIHCAAGISRSAAICLYLHIIHRYELKPKFYHVSRPNKYVLGYLMFAKFCDLS